MPQELEEGKSYLPGEISIVHVLANGEKSAEVIVVGRNEPSIDTTEVSQNAVKD